MNYPDNDILYNQMTSEEEIIMSIYNYSNWKSYVDDRLQYREYVLPENSDDSLEDLIKWYTDKKSKRVQYAGKKLKKVFTELPPVEQRRVGLALLTGGKLDTEWVCEKLDNRKMPSNNEWIVTWHPCYAEAVEACWNKYHGEYCAKIMIQFINEDIVRKYINEFIELGLYFELCRRFVNRSWFDVDVQKLKSCISINAYLSIMSQLPEGISAEEARTLLYQWIAAIAFGISKDDSLFSGRYIFWRPMLNEHKIIYASGIDTALLYLLRMKHNNVVEEFINWNNIVCQKYYKSLQNKEDSYNNELDFVNTILDNFPEDMKYLTCINDVQYNYMMSLGHPYVIPQLSEYCKNDEYIYPIYIDKEIEYKLHNREPILAPLPEDSYVKINNEIFYTIDRRREYKKLLNEYPDLKLLVDNFDLELNKPKKKNTL